MMEKVKASPSLMASRLGVSAIFFVVGAGFATWVSRIPEIKDSLSLSEASLGFAIMAMSVGVVLGLLLTSGLIARFSSRRVTIGAGILMCLLLPVVALAQDFFSLAAALFFFGMFTSMTDVSMNAQGAEVERLRQRQIMNSFHGAWSIGTFSGAAIGSVLVGMEISVLNHFVLMGGIFVVLLLIAGIPLLPIAGEESPENTSAFQLPPLVLLPLGAIAFSSAVAEGSMADWSGLYLRDIVGVVEVQAAWGFVAVSATMTIGRFMGDKLADRFGAENMVRGGGILASLGLILALVFLSLPISLIGFAMVGAGLAVNVPLAFSAASKIEGLATGRGIAGVATIGYGGFLIGPSFIGLIANATNLRIAMVFVLLLLLSLIYFGRALRPNKKKSLKI